MTPQEQETAHLRERFVRLDTPAVSDALDSLGIPGALAGIQARVAGVVTAGPAFTVRYRAFERSVGEFHNAGNYIDQVPAGSVILIDNEASTTCTNWGGLLTVMARLKGISGTVINGSARDLAEVRHLNYPLFSVAVTMVSAKNRARVTGLQVPVVVGTVEVTPGDWLVGDDNGVLAIPAARVVEVLERAEAIDRTESRIREAIKGGMSLVEARGALGYDRPWDERKAAP
jgi:regulator of RNase E activity RraA